MIRVLLADDEDLIRGAVAALLELEPDIEVVEQAGDGRDAVEKVLAHRPDVAVVDLQMPELSGMAVAAEVAAADASCAVVILTGHGRPSLLRRALQSGARGFVPKGSPAAVLAEVIRRVHEGGRYVDPALAAEMLLILPLGYVIVAALGRRRATWPVVAVLTALLVALRLQDGVEPFVVLLAVALAAVLWGSGHGRHRERDFRLQLAGMVGFGALALAGMAVEPDLARHLVAVGWLAHGVWDWVHLAKDRVVSRSFAEWCAALDVMIGAGLIIVPLL